MIERSCRERQPLSVALRRQRGRRVPRARPPRRAARRRHRPDLRARSGERLPAAGLDGGAVAAKRASDPAGVDRGREAVDGRARRGRCWRSQDAGVPTFDYGNNIRQMAKDEGVARRVRLPGLRARVHPPALLPRRRAVPLGGAVGRPRGHLQDRREGEGADAGRRAPAPLARHGARAHPLPGPAGAHLLGRARRPAPAGPRVQRDGARGRAEGADRDRPRPPRFRIGGLAQPRDRSDARRLRRGVRLAAAERAAQLRVGRHVGVAAPRRRRGHGLLAARRHGDRVRRQRRGRRAAGARAVERPGHRRDASCRCRLRRGDRVRAAARAAACR